MEMSEKYYVSNGDGAKEVEIIKKEDPFKSILAKAEAKKIEEKPKDDLVAGDETIPYSKAAFAGKEEGVELPKDLVYGHCNNCRVELTEDKVVKNAIDWLRNEDGSLSKKANRFSVFCKQCMKFITVIDQDAAQMLQNMIRKGIK